MILDRSQRVGLYGATAEAVSKAERNEGNACTAARSKTESQVQCDCRLEHCPKETCEENFPQQV